METNEIRDYIKRAPKARYFNGTSIVWTTYIRMKWICELAHGSIDVRINRRAGIVDTYCPWKNPIYKSVARHERKLAIMS